jgi:hypothetical protein
MLVTSLAFRSPHCGACPGCPGLSTATKLARTLLTGVLVSEFSASNGDLPRLGGDVDWSLEALFSNIARRFRTPEELLEDMTVRQEQSQRLQRGKHRSREVRRNVFAIRDMMSGMCVQTQEGKWSLRVRVPAETGIGVNPGKSLSSRVSGALPCHISAGVGFSTYTRNPGDTTSRWTQIAAQEMHMLDDVCSC